MICVKNKFFYPVLAVLVFLLVAGYVPSLNKTMKGVFNLQAIAGGKGPNKSSNHKPVTFIENVKILSADSATKVLHGIGETGSHGAQDFMYKELDYDFSNAAIENKEGNIKTADDVSTAKRVYLHGINYQDGTFEITKVVIVEPQ